jgi:hypothetical protein
MVKASRMLLALVLLTVAGCGLDFGSPPSSEPALLKGTWNGAMEDEVPSLHTITMVFNKNGQISEVLVDGGATGLTASVDGVEGSSVFFSFLLSDGFQGGLLTDSSFRHAGFVYEGGSAGSLVAGVLEKSGATGILYTIDDIKGTSWKGSNLVLDSGLNYVSSVSSTAYVDTIPNITGDQGTADEFSADLALDNATVGFYSGTYFKPPPPEIPSETGSLGVFLSPDKIFAGSYACTSAARNTESCNYYTWKKQ